MEWLSAAADNPVECRQVWSDDPRMPCLLPTGRFFDVVSVEQRLGMEMFDRLLRSAMPFGPTVIDRKAQRVRGSDQRSGQGDGAQRIGFRSPRRRAEPLIAVVGQRDGARHHDGTVLAQVPVRLLARIDRFDEQYPTPYAAVAALSEESSTDAD